jgi:hypothetical protein
MRPKQLIHPKIVNYTFGSENIFWHFDCSEIWRLSKALAGTAVARFAVSVHPARRGRAGGAVFCWAEIAVIG